MDRSRAGLSLEQAVAEGLGSPSRESPLAADRLASAILDQTPDTVFAKDLVGRYIYINRAGAAACGLSRDAVLGQRDHDLFPREVADSLVAFDRATLAVGGEEIYEESVSINGAMTEHLVTKTPFRDSDGQIIGLIGLVKDITGRKRPEGLGRTDTDRLTDIIELQQAVGTAVMEPSAFMQLIVQRTRDLMGANGAAILLRDGEDLVIRAAAGTTVMGLGLRVPIDRSLVGACFRSNQAVQCDDVQNDPRVRLAACELFQVRSAVVVPLRDGLTTIGVLEAIADVPGFFGESARQTMLLVGGLLSAALARSTAFEANRRLLDERTTTLAALFGSEERLRSAMDAAQIGVWDWDVVGGRITWLGHHEAICGLAPGSFDGRYETFLACVHPEDRPGMEAALTSALASNSEYSHSHRVVWPDGSVHWVLGRGEFRRDPEGHTIRMYGAIMDITDRRVLEHQLLQAQKIEAMGQLAAGIAHEINTPTQYVGDNLHFLQEAFEGLLRVMVVYGDVVEAARAVGVPVAAADAAWKSADGGYLLAEIPRATVQALDGIERVTKIVRAMKEFSHPGGTEAIPVDLNHAIENTIAVSRNEWKYLADMVLELSPDLPPVPCLAGEIQQVILNLIVNAAHAIGDVVAESGGRGTIRISTTVVEGFVEVRVRDSGTGIPLEVRSRVFDPFFTTKDVGRGTGQGLALARDAIVRKHRGSLTFESEVGAGTCFLIRLPLHAPDQPGAES
ncbi:MAG: ATP-binding protein [Gemmatimonadales bacterium]